MNVYIHQQDNWPVDSEWLNQLQQRIVFPKFLVLKFNLPALINGMEQTVKVFSAHLLQLVSEIIISELCCIS